MLDFQYHSPTQFVFGPDREKEAGARCKACAAKRVLIHYGSGSVIRSGLLQRVEDSLQAAGIAYLKLGGAVPNPHDTLVYEGIDLCRRENIDFVLGIGGGSAIDSAKAIAIGTCYDGDFWDLYSQRAQPASRLGLGTIVTLPATGTEGSNSSVITRTADLLKRGLRSDLNRPDFSIINPCLTETLPVWQIACGAADIISHVLERYFTRTEQVTLTDHLCEGVLKTVLEVTPQILADPDAYGPRANLMWASTIAHIGLLGTGRQEDWSVHALEHELSALYDVAHGAGLAALYPAWMQYLLPSDPDRFARLACQVFVSERNCKDHQQFGLDGIRQMARFFSKIGLPVNLRDLGVRKEDINKLAAKVKRNPDGSCGHYLPLQDEDILAIYEMAYDWSESTLNR
ncbi:MAG: iron-containing alcohol dehydrogenase [Ruminococcaceae bacterium]|jgi:alcohol dehydrogenase YqhD (iron-dependent ADH family)|nr:iron-containing alcohol dehydrogenase [Oscillospiraceae bacterium]